MRIMITKKYINLITGQEITVYPWSSKKDKLRVKQENWYEMFRDDSND